MGLHNTITEEKTQRLGIPTGIEGGSFAVTKITAAKNEPGYIVDGERVEEWRFLGVTYLDGEPWLYGPMVEGPSLAEMLERPQDEALAAVLTLARALAVLARRDVPPFRLQSEAVIYRSEGGLLFLPPKMMGLLKDSRPLEYRLRAYEAINHPYAKGKDAPAYTVAILAYRVLTGRYPFMDETEDGIRDQVRRLRVTPAHLARPGIKEEASELLTKALARPGAVSLEAWIDALEAWQRESPFREVSAADRAAIDAKAREYREKATRSLRTSVFFEKNGRMLLVAAVGVALVAAVASSILKNALAPRVTKGFSPEKVVETFYNSIGKLDHETMQACVIDGAGKAEISEVINLFVISRQTIAYEGKSYVIDAAQWDAKGRPPVTAPSFVFGVTQLHITRERDVPNPVFLATYERYDKAFADQSIETAPPVNGRRITDRLYLKQDKGDWVIYRIDRLRTEPLKK